MPDLATHVGLLYVFVRLFQPKLTIFSRKPYLFVILCLGTILPDVLTRVPLVILAREVFFFFAPLHTPVLLFLTCYLTSMLFEVNLRKSIFIILIFGAALHLFLDSLQKTIGDNGYPWFFPFSLKTFNFGLFWPTESIFFIPIILITIIVIHLLKK